MCVCVWEGGGGGGVGGWGGLVGGVGEGGYVHGVKKPVYAPQWKMLLK